MRSTTVWGESLGSGWALGDVLGAKFVLRRTTVGGDDVAAVGPEGAFGGAFTFLRPPRAFSIPPSEKFIATPGIGAA